MICIIGFSKIKPRFFMLKFFSIDGTSILDLQSNLQLKRPFFVVQERQARGWANTVLHVLH